MSKVFQIYIVLSLRVHWTCCFHGINLHLYTHQLVDGVSLDLELGWGKNEGGKTGGANSWLRPWTLSLDLLNWNRFAQHLWEFPYFTLSHHWNPGFSLVLYKQKSFVERSTNSTFFGSFKFKNIICLHKSQQILTKNHNFFVHSVTSFFHITLWSTRIFSFCCTFPAFSRQLDIFCLYSFFKWINIYSSMLGSFSASF